MTILLRVLSMISILLAIVFIGMSCMPLFIDSFRVRDIIASIVFLVLGVLAIRSARWLWRTQRFWTEKRSFAEVCSLATVILLWPLIALLELRTAGLAKDAVHVVFAVAVVAVYILVKRYARFPAQTHSES